MNLFAAALVAFLALACAPRAAERAEPPLSSEREAVINGQDDRRELYELDAADARASLVASVAALMWSHRIDYAHPSVLNAVSLQAALGVCADERFAQQPAAAWCSATLIDDDLVLTAGHCLGPAAGDAARFCNELLIVFDYHYAGADRLAFSVGDNVYACRAVARYEHSASAESFRDLAILQLDRPVSVARQPATLASDAPSVGQALIAATHSSGLPLKVDSGGEVTGVPSGAEYFVASTDSFAGGSGGPIFNTSLELVGHQVRGLSDWVSDGECQRAAHADAPNEQHQRVGTSIQALCDGGWPSERLCGRAPRCGDGVCSAGETQHDCGDDCHAPSCGDGVCELEERTACGADCAAYAGVPPDWLAEPASFPTPGTEPAVAGASSVPGDGRRPVSGSSAGCSFSGEPTRSAASAWTCWLGFAAFGTRARRVVRRRASRGPRRARCREET